MDNSIVFAKTKEGEEAVRQRTRLVQRNLRNILIMVDGHSNVADLARRFGDANATEVALNELIASGFISAVSGPSPAGSTKSPEETLAEKPDDLPVLTSPLGNQSVPGQQQPEPAPPPQATPTQQSPSQPTAVDRAQSSPGPLTHPPSLPPEFDDAPLVMHEYQSTSPVFDPAEAWRASVPQPAGSGILEKLKTLLTTKRDIPERPPREADSRDTDVAPAIEQFEIEPIRRGARLPLGWPALSVLGLVALAILLVLIAFLFPYGRYLPGIEQKASAALKDVVKIGDIGFAILPRPHIYLSNIKVGQDGYLSVPSARAVPDFMSLLGDATTVSELVLERPIVSSRGLEKLARAGRSPGLEIQHIALKELTFVVGAASSPGLTGEVEMTDSGDPRRILLRTSEGTLQLELTPANGEFQFAASGNAWRMPVKAGLALDRLDAQGAMNSARLVINKLDAKAYDGLIEGKASLEWAGVLTLAGELDLKRLNVASVLGALGSGFAGEGELNAKVRFEGGAQSFASLPDSLVAEAAFDVKRGAVSGFDLGEAMRNTTNRAPTRGGITRFEQLSGALQTDAKTMRLSNLQLASGLFRATGNINVSEASQLNGAISAELKSSASTLKMPLTVSGTPKEALLSPARGR